MNKKTKTIIIVVLAVVVCGGVYYAYNNWRKQQLVRAYLTQCGVPPAMVGEAMKQLSAQDMAAIQQGAAGGGALGGLASALTGAGTVGGGVAGLFGGSSGMPIEEDEEKPKSPEQLYDEAIEMQVFDDNSKFVVNETKPIIEQIFGKAKMTSVSGNFGNEDAQVGILNYRIARKITGNDITLLNKALTDKGYTIMMSNLSGKEGAVTASKGENIQISFGFQVEEQDVGVNYYKMNY